MKVGLIGPIHPFRSGEAQSNTMLCENLALNHDVVAYSFKMLYPKLLFPGKSQTYDSQKVLNFERKFILNTMNPINWIISFFKIRSRHLDVVLVTWHAIFLAPILMTLLSLLKIFSKTEICIFAHNVYPHEDSILNKMIAWPVLALGDYFIVLSSKTEYDLKQIFPKAKVKILVETTYDQHFKQNVLPKEVARQRLNLEKDKKMIEERIVVIQGLIDNQSRLSRILGEFSASILNEVWVDNFNSSANQTFDFTANTFNNYLIAKYMVALKNEPTFDNIELEYVKKTTIKEEDVDVDIVNFKLSGIFIPKRLE